VAIQEQELEPDHPDVALSLMNLADLYADCGRSAEAEQRYVRALAIWERAHELFGPNHPDVAECLNGLARVYRDQGSHAEAETVLTRALAIREKTLGPDHPLTRDSCEHSTLFTRSRRDPESVATWRLCASMALLSEGDRTHRNNLHPARRRSPMLETALKERRDVRLSECLAVT
jgi:tetratricopeptide (TPR) repeat protein